jgi:hypothetical protein
VLLTVTLVTLTTGQQRRAMRSVPEPLRRSVTDSTSTASRFINRSISLLHEVISRASATSAAK